MMRVYICPECGWIRTVSRRKVVECYKCNCQQMELSKLSYMEYTQMDEKKRKDYAESWLYIHNRKKGS